MKRFALLPLIALLSVAATAAEIKGTVTYRERMALPADAVVAIKLQEIGGEGEAEPVAEIEFMAGGKQVPIPYILHYMPQALRKDGRYTIVASIKMYRQPVFMTKTPVSFKPGTRQVNLTLSKVAENSLHSIMGEWQLVMLNVSTPRLTARSGAEISLGEGGKLTGRGGVNRFSGQFAVRGNTINFVLGPMTMMGGSKEKMELEADFVKALNAAQTWRLNELNFELLQGKRVVARFVRPEGD